MTQLKSLPLIALCALLLIGCRSTPSSDGQHPSEKLRFVFVTCLVHEQFFKPVIKGMEDAARLMEVDCHFTGTEGVDVAAQAEMVRAAIRDGYDGIVVNIIDTAAFDEVALEAARAGIPLLGFNVDDDATPKTHLSSVNQQLYAAGRTLGREAARSLTNGSHILMTMHDEGVSALYDRLRGAQDGLREAGLDQVSWKVVITGSTAEASSKVIAAELERDSLIRFVLCTGQADTEGAGRAIGEHFAGQNRTAMGFDLSAGILQSIREGHLAFTIDQQPYMQGFFPVVQLALLKRYGIQPSNIDAGAALIDKNNVEAVAGWVERGYR